MSNEPSPVLITILALTLVVVVVLVLLVIQSRRSSVVVTSTSSTSTCTGPPQIAAAPTITNPQGDLLTITWPAVASADSYASYLGITPGFNPDNSSQKKTTSSNSVSFANLVIGATYYFKYLANNSCGSGPLSNEVNYTIPYTYPTRFLLSPANDASRVMCAPTATTTPFCTANDSRLVRAADTTIRLVSDNNSCLTRVTSSADVEFMSCNAGTTQTWTYNATDKTLCSVNTPGANCLLSVPNDNIGLAYYGNKTGSSNQEWNLIDV